MVIHEIKTEIRNQPRSALKHEILPCPRIRLRVESKGGKFIPPPKVDYRPKKPKAYKPKIGLIGTGGISEFHLRNYQSCGFEVAAFPIALVPLWRVNVMNFNVMRKSIVIIERCLPATISRSLTLLLIQRIV